MPATRFRSVLNQRSLTTNVTLAEATLHDGQRLLAFNDFFIGASSHVSARYEIRVGEESESHSSSGILVCDGSRFDRLDVIGGQHDSAASPAGWGATSTKPDVDGSRMEWRRPLVWSWTVREPFLSQQSGISLIAGRIKEREELVIESRMPSGGVIFSDGIESDFLPFNGGTIARIGVAEQRAQLVVPTLRRPPRGRS